MRQKLAHISKSKAALVGAAAVAVVAVVGTTVGYASMGKSVTLNVDGHIEHVTATGDTVGQVLSAEGITLTSRTTRSPPRSTSRSRTVPRSRSATASP